VITHGNSLPIFSTTVTCQPLYANVGFYVRPEAGQEGVADVDKMWRVAAVAEEDYENHGSFFFLVFPGHVNQAQVVHLVRSLLASGTRRGE
jgi:hypothetical protein